MWGNEDKKKERVYYESCPSPVHTDNAECLDEIQEGCVVTECRTLFCALPHQEHLNQKE